MYYTWITENIAIGELSSKYDEFDFIINLAYINPSFNKGLKHREHRNYKINDKEVYEFGLYDSDSDADYFREVIDFLIPKLKFDQKILFHCQSGKSRSVCVALTYMCIFYKIDLDKALSICKEKRSIINPRESFLIKIKDLVKFI